MFVVTLKYMQPWWNQEHRNLNFIDRSVSITTQLTEWHNKGFDRFISFSGGSCDFYDPQNSPEFILPFYNLFDWKNIGISVLKLKPGHGLPEHKDYYLSYKNKLGLNNNCVIYRCNVFLEDWKSGHYFEFNGTGVVNWQAGNYIVWENDTKHGALNFGVDDRYTLQITGHI